MFSSVYRVIEHYSHDLILSVSSSTYLHRDTLRALNAGKFLVEEIAARESVFQPVATIVFPNLFLRKTQATIYTRDRFIVIPVSIAVGDVTYICVIIIRIPFGDTTAGIREQIPL